MADDASTRADHASTRAVDRVAAFVRDIEAIPDVIEDLADAGWLAEPIALARGARRVLLTGLGSSRYAALQVEDRLRAAGIDVSVSPASSDADPPAAPDLLCVAISSSGRTAETVAAAECHGVRVAAGRPGSGRRGALAITRDAASPLAAAADAVAVLPVEAESSGIATTSWAATLAALAHLADALCGDSSAAATLRAASAAARRILADRGTWLPPALDALDAAEEVAVLAPWSQRGAAEQAALLFREGPRRSAVAFETAEWLHVGIYTALPVTAAVLFPGSPAGAEVARVIETRGGRIARLPDSGLTAVATGLSGIPGIPEAIAAALLAAELWRRVTEPRGG